MHDYNIDAAYNEAVERLNFYFTGIKRTAAEGFLRLYPGNSLLELTTSFVDFENSLTTVAERFEVPLEKVFQDLKCSKEEKQVLLEQALAGEIKKSIQEMEFSENPSIKRGLHQKDDQTVIPYFQFELLEEGRKRGIDDCNFYKIASSAGLTPDKTKNLIVQEFVRQAKQTLGFIEQAAESGALRRERETLVSIILRGMFNPFSDNKVGLFSFISSLEKGCEIIGIDFNDTKKIIGFTYEKEQKLIEKEKDLRIKRVIGRTEELFQNLQDAISSGEIEEKIHQKLHSLACQLYVQNKDSSRYYDARHRDSCQQAGVDPAIVFKALGITEKQFHALEGFNDIGFKRRTINIPPSMERAQLYMASLYGKVISANEVKLGEILVKVAGFSIEDTGRFSIGHELKVLAQNAEAGVATRKTIPLSVKNMGSSKSSSFSAPCP